MIQHIWTTCLLGLLLLPNLAAAEPERLTVLFTNNTNGILEACTCPGNPMGGLGQRLTELERIRAQEPVSLTVSAGDIFELNREPEKNLALLKIFALLGYDAINVGDQELIYGPQYLQDAAKTLPFVSTSLYHRQERRYLVEPRIEKELPSGRKVYIYGVADKRAFAFADPDNIAQVSIKGLAQVVNAKLLGHKQEDIVILLSHLSLSSNFQLAGEVKNLDLIVSGHSQDLLEKAVMIDGVVVVAAGKNGEQLGVISLALEAGRVRSFEHQLIPLIKEIPAAPQVKELIREYDKLVNATILQRYNENKPSYMGAQSCQPCHEKAYQAWQKSQHSRAMESIFAAYKEYDYSCLECHSLGMQIEKEAGIECESCHTISKGHQQDQQVVSRASAETCLRCHTKLRSVDFDFAKYWAQIKH